MTPRTRWTAAAILCGVLVPTIHCGGSTNGPAVTTYRVTYQLTFNDILYLDSLKYDDGTGSLVKAIGPTGWAHTLVLVPGSSVEAFAWLSSPLGGSGFARLTATRYPNGDLTQGQTDTSAITTNTPSSNVVHILRRVL